MSAGQSQLSDHIVEYVGRPLRASDIVLLTRSIRDQIQGPALAAVVEKTF